ncbi:MAG TPA: glycosyltransferase family 4 protein [Noviherbaspirillum sp.]|uniref:glycosyltransferase family 4 protein n=1 Tax=Noviherbaspirillum sp. TaxID=1926288 RepID=UPI002D691C4E|nr:glycosyltransferase family 4 protein [Noviherbaspirillum sp.]HYD97549.1 glycosyltransferase family 4 protein [Noviherbaspirillum sp.]
MNILFVHQSFPGQYRHLAPALAARGHQVAALTMGAKPAAQPGVNVVRYTVRRGNAPGMHPWAAEFETKVLRGESAAFASLKLGTEGFKPDVICAHPGWGEALFLKDVWPDARLLTYCEFYYRAYGADMNFDPEFATPGTGADARIRAKNAGNLLSLEATDWGISPTHWQRSLFPEWAQSRISVIHDGIDTSLARPDPRARLQLEEFGLDLRHGDEVVTFVNRNLEPQRGCHVFMRALPELLRRRPKAQVLIVGGDKQGYGAPPPAGRTWKEVFLDEVRADIDLARVHFLGTVPYPVFLRLLQVSAAHVYLTYPFVLSWSALEAMSSGCLVIGSRTGPVEEVIDDGRNGLLVDFFDPQALACTIADALADPGACLPLRERARADALAKYDLHGVCLPRQVALVEALAEQVPPALPVAAPFQTPGVTTC